MKSETDLTDTTELANRIVVLEYEDAEGDLTRRRVTLHGLAASQAGVSFLAYCHERRAARRFRLDRVVSVIDDDGVLLNVDEWLAAIGARVPTPPQADDALTIAEMLRDRMRPALSLLTELARAADGIAQAELAAILLFIEDEADELGLPWTPAAIDRLQSLLTSMHPRESSLPAYRLTVETYRPSRRARFARAVRGVVDADGFAQSAEIALVEQMARWANGEDVAPEILARFAPPA